MDLLLSDKYKKFIKHNAPVEFLEGTTFAGKTTVGVFKFMLMVAKSKKKLHILSGLDLGTIEKNIINKDLGILDIFSGLVEYNPKGKGQHSLPHIILKTKEEKIIYILGYDNKARWKKALGGQYGCLYIDEINTADMDYVREASMRCDYMIATLNPDDPNLQIYKEYINHSRPMKEYKDDAPKEILNMLSEPKKEGWVWWYFSFDDNEALTEEKKKQIVANVPIGSKIYKNKILGIRGKATGLVFNNFDEKKHVITKEKAKEYKYKQFTAGLDTAYSTQSEDTIAMVFVGITDKGEMIQLDEKIYNNRDLNIELAPSDTVKNFLDFLERNREEWGLARNVFIDSADQATITELKKNKRNNPNLYVFNNAYKKVEIIDRINFEMNWLHTNSFFIVDKCKESIREMNLYSWKEDKDNEPEDRNNHTIDARAYSWIPYREMIGKEKK